MWIGAGSGATVRRSANEIVEDTRMCVQTTERLQQATGWSRVDGETTLGGAETILFVEDEAFVRNVTCEVLQSAGYQVLPAKNAAEAMHLYEQNAGEVDLLLSDVVLPGETGWALACKLRRENPVLAILLITGYAEQMGLREARPEEFLAKPFSTETLLRRVRQLLDRSELRIGAEEMVRRAGDNA
jgi:CheY-like chemotaxis protein